jgi:hypothetical protein
MNAVTLPADLQAWAEAEVAAGRAQSVEQLAAAALTDYRRRLDDFLGSLDQAEANRDAWRDADEVFDEIEAKLEVARGQIARGEGVDGDVFLAELDRWIAEDLAGETKD